MNVDQLMEALGVTESDLSPSSSEFEMQGSTEIFFFSFLFYMKGNVVMLDFVFRIYSIDVESWEIIVTVDKT